MDSRIAQVRDDIDEILRCDRLRIILHRAIEELFAGASGTAGDLPGDLSRRVVIQTGEEWPRNRPCSPRKLRILGDPVAVNALQRDECAAPRKLVAIGKIGI